MASQGCGGQRIRTSTSGLVVLKGPRGDCEFVLVRLIIGRAGERLDVPIFRKEDSDLATESLANMRDDDVSDVIKVRSGGQVAAEVVEGRCLRFALNGSLSLLAYLCGE